MKYVGDGQERILGPGEALGIPGDVPHSAVALEHTRSEVVTEPSQNCFEVAPPQFAAAAAWVYSLGMDDST